MVTSRNYCAELLQSSPPLSVEDIETNISVRNLGLFDTLSLPESTGGQLAFVGGPTYALDWHQDGTYLAVGAHRSAHPVHQLMETYHGAAHIQIWCVQPDAKRLSISHLIPHDGDCTWDVKWRPGRGLGDSTLAAALADGQLVLYRPTLPPKECDSQSLALPVFPRPVPHLTLRAGQRYHDAVRTIQWNPGGTFLAAGTVHGCIELYRIVKNGAAVPQMVTQLIVRVRAHESAISSMCWLNYNNLCSAGFDGTQRVRDVRDCLTELERVSDGPAWNLCLVNPEENVIISGSDSGFLKIARLATMSTTLTALEVKKTRVTIASLRDLATMRYQGQQRTVSTALFLGGGEGRLAVGTLVYPLWSSSGCMLRKSRFRPVIQWVKEPWKGDTESQKRKKIKSELNDQVGEEKNSESLNSLRWPRNVAVKDVSGLDCNKNSSLLLRLTKAVRRDARLSRRPKSKKNCYQSVPVDVNLCAEHYDQQVAITRIALTISGKMIATGTHAGFLTILPVSDSMIFGAHADRLPKKRSDKDVADNVLVSIPLRIRRKPCAAVLLPVPLRIRIRPGRRTRVRKETARKASYMASLRKGRVA